MTTPARPGDVVGVRLNTVFARARAERRGVLIPYVTGGFPSMDACDRAIAEFVAAGADIVELGVPCSDPLADGPVVQASTHTALEAGVTTDDVFDLAAGHSRDVPFVLLIYVNNVLAYGPERFFHRCFQTGVDGVVMPDLPVDEAGELIATAAADGVAVILLAAPTSTDDRLDLIAAAAQGFVYCVAVTGVTGARTTDSDELPDLVSRLRARTTLPLVAGFGISTPEQAARAARHADGVIVGSALIRILAEKDEGGGLAEAAALVHAAAQALRA